MESGKLCIDIGGTKTIFALIDKKGIVKSKRIDTAITKQAFLEDMKRNIEEYLPLSNGIINISIAGRVNHKGKVIFCPNLPIKGVNFLDFLRKFSNNVNIENDGNCFGLYQLYKGYLRGANSGLIVVWGTGIGNSIIYKNRIYEGGGFATESGHIIVDYKTGKSAEDMIGGKSIIKRYKMNGLEMHNLAEKGNKKAIASFNSIGKMFGYYLSSMCFVIDPETIVIGGSFVNSWKFMEKSVYEILRSNPLRKNVKVKIVKGKFYVIRGCYFIDEHKSFNNKL